MGISKILYFVYPVQIAKYISHRVLSTPLLIIWFLVFVQGWSTLNTYKIIGKWLLSFSSNWVFKLDSTCRYMLMNNEHKSIIHTLGITQSNCLKSWEYHRLRQLIFYFHRFLSRDKFTRMPLNIYLTNIHAFHSFMGYEKSKVSFCF